MRYLDDVDPRGANQHGASAPGQGGATFRARTRARGRREENLHGCASEIAPCPPFVGFVSTPGGRFWKIAASRPSTPRPHRLSLLCSFLECLPSISVQMPAFPGTVHSQTYTLVDLGIWCASAMTHPGAAPTFGGSPSRPGATSSGIGRRQEAPDAFSGAVTSCTMI